MDRLSAAVFEKAIQNMVMADHLRVITRGVLVDGKPHVEFVRQYGLTRSAITHACKRVRDMVLIQQAQDQGLVQVNVWLSRPEASVVQGWADKYPINHHERSAHEGSHRRHSERRSRQNQSVLPPGI